MIFKEFKFFDCIGCIVNNQFISFNIASIRRILSFSLQVLFENVSFVLTNRQNFFVKWCIVLKKIYLDTYTKKNLKEIVVYKSFLFVHLTNVRNRSTTSSLPLYFIKTVRMSGWKGIREWSQVVTFWRHSFLRIRDRERPFQTFSAIASN